MTDDARLVQYAQDLKRALQAAEANALDLATKAVRSAPSKVEILDVGIHMDQEASGHLTLMIHPIGPDSFVLNKAIADFRTLFDGKVPTGLEPGGPFEQVEAVVAVATEVCADWAADLWRKLPADLRDTPATVTFSEEALAEPVSRWIGGPEASS